MRGNTNSQNNRLSLLAFKNSRTVHEVPLQGLVFGVWCAVNARKIMGLVSLKETNSRRCFRLAVATLFKEIMKVTVYGYFTHGSDTAYITNFSMTAI